jgi:hypothetical protein
MQPERPKPNRIGEDEKQLTVAYFVCRFLFKRLVIYYILRYQDYVTSEEYLSLLYPKIRELCPVWVWQMIIVPSIVYGINISSAIQVGLVKNVLSNFSIVFSFQIKKISNEMINISSKFLHIINMNHVMILLNVSINNLLRKTQHNNDDKLIRKKK